MQTFSSRDVQTRYGEVVDFAKREPVMVTQYGREAFMMLPIGIGKEAVRLYNAAQFAHLIASMPSPKPGAPALTEQDINQLVHELRT